MLRAFCCEVWRRSDGIFWGKIAIVLEPFKNWFHPCPSIKRNSELKILQNRWKYHFGGKRTKFTEDKANYICYANRLCGLPVVPFYHSGMTRSKQVNRIQKLEECSFSFPIKLHTPLKVNDLNGFPMLITSFTPKYFHSEQQLISFSWFSWLRDSEGACKNSANLVA